MHFLIHRKSPEQLHGAHLELEREIRDGPESVLTFRSLSLRSVTVYICTAAWSAKLRAGRRCTQVHFSPGHCPRGQFCCTRSIGLCYIFPMEGCFLSFPFMCTGSVEDLLTGLKANCFFSLCLVKVIFSCAGSLNRSTCMITHNSARKKAGLYDLHYREEDGIPIGSSYCGT